MERTDLQFGRSKLAIEEIALYSEWLESRGEQRSLGEDARTNTRVSVRFATEFDILLRIVRGEELYPHSAG